MAAVDLPPPSPNQPYTNISALEAGILNLNLVDFIAGAQEGDVVYDVPSLAFLLRHSVTGDHIVFDLGIRRKYETYPPSIRRRIETHSRARVPRSVDESLREGGVNPEDVKTVVISHVHWDHVGDTTPFTNATFILGGESEEALRTADASSPKCIVDPNSVPLDRARFLPADIFNTSIGPFPRAYDYYGDGSLYIVDAAGHLPGHINVLARTDPYGSWIYLAADSCHDLRIVLGEKEIAVHVHSDGSTFCMHTNLEQAKEHIRRVGTLYDNPHVEVILAHDWKWYEAAKVTGKVFFPGVIPPKNPSSNVKS